MHRLIAAMIILIPALYGMPVFAAKCMLVMSYHQGYVWNDGLQKGVESVLQGKCDLRVFYMDTKRNKTVAYAEAMARKAVQEITAWQPDVMIAADDNASRYLVSRYYKNADLPVVFCGVNWDVSKYGYPYRNVTGMIEVAPIQPVFEASKKTVGDIKRVFYLGANTFSEKKNASRVKNVFRKQGVTTDIVLVSNLADWKRAFIKGQSYDMVMLGGNAGIDHWQHQEVVDFVQQNTKKWSVTNHGWMKEFAMYAMTKIAEEQGEWAAEAALAILNGLPPAKIPIRVNRKWQVFMNTVLLSKVGIGRQHDIFANAIEVTQ